MSRLQLEIGMEIWRELCALYSGERIAELADITALDLGPVDSVFVRMLDEPDELVGAM